MCAYDMTHKIIQTRSTETVERSWFKEDNVTSQNSENCSLAASNYIYIIADDFWSRSQVTMRMLSSLPAHLKKSHGMVKSNFSFALIAQALAGRTIVFPP